MKALVSFLLLGFISFLMSCDGEIIHTPKPRSYPKVELPSKSYQPFKESFCGFTFEYPTYAKIEQDTAFFDGKPKDPCWFDVVIPSLNGRIHCSYLPLNKRGSESFDKLLNDAFKMADEHVIKADYIDQYPLNKENGVHGMVFDIDGPAASPFQFYLTDSTEHFLRGSVYVRAKADPDSLAPIIEFLKVDAIHMLNTFDWNQ